MTDETPTPDKKPAPDAPGTPRFYKLSDVAAVLTISESQVYALVRSGDLPAIKIGGRGQWRVEAARLEQWIAEQYEKTRKFVRDNPLNEPRSTTTDDE